MSIDELSAISGVSRSIISHLESGYLPSWASIRKIADALGVKPERFFFPEHIREIVTVREMTMREALEVFRRSIRWQRWAADLPSDIVNAIGVLSPESVREKLGLPPPESHAPIAKGLQPFSEARSKLARERSAARAQAAREEKARLEQLNYEKMMWEANKEELLKKPKMRDE